MVTIKAAALADMPLFHWTLEINTRSKLTNQSTNVTWLHNLWWWYIKRWYITSYSIHDLIVLYLFSRRHSRRSIKSRESYPLVFQIIPFNVITLHHTKTITFLLIMALYNCTQPNWIFFLSLGLCFLYSSMSSIFSYIIIWDIQAWRIK